MKSHLQFEVIKPKMKLVPARLSSWDADVEKMERQIQLGSGFSR